MWKANCTSSWDVARGWLDTLTGCWSRDLGTTRSTFWATCSKTWGKYFRLALKPFRQSRSGVRAWRYHSYLVLSYRTTGSCPRPLSTIINTQRTLLWSLLTIPGEVNVQVNWMYNLFYCSLVILQPIQMLMFKPSSEASLDNGFILTMEQIIICNVTGVTYRTNSSSPWLMIQV